MTKIAAIASTAAERLSQAIMRGGRDRLAGRATRPGWRCASYGMRLVLFGHDVVSSAPAKASRCAERRARLPLAEREGQGEPSQ